MFTERYNEDNLGGEEIKIKIKKVERRTLQKRCQKNKSRKQLLKSDLSSNFETQSNYYMVGKSPIYQ